jgi:hypothetical protein
VPLCLGGENRASPLPDIPAFLSKIELRNSANSAHIRHSECHFPNNKYITHRLGSRRKNIPARKNTLKNFAKVTLLCFLTRHSPSPSPKTLRKNTP